MGKGGGFRGTTAATLPTSTLTIRARAVIITLDTMDTAPVAGSGDLASFLLPGPRGRQRAGLGLRSVRRRGGTERRYTDGSIQHGEEERWRRGARGLKVWDEKGSWRETCGV